MLKQTVILVGGMGTRLGALTASTPKPLLLIDDKPFLDHLIQEVSRFGFQRVTLLAGNLGYKFRDAYDNRSLHGLKIDVLLEDRPMGTGGAIRLAAEKNRLDSEFLLLNGDSWIDADLTSFSRHWDRCRSNLPTTQVLLLLRDVEDASRFGSVEVSEGLVTEFREKNASVPPGPGCINAGVYVMDRVTARQISTTGPVSLEREVLPALVKEGRVAAMKADPRSYFIDIGLPETLEQSRTQLALRRMRPAIFFDRDGTLNEDHGYTHKCEDLSWLPGAREAIKLANDSGYFAFVVTNQSGIARGYYDEADVANFHGAMQADLYEYGAHIDAFRWCPHHQEGIVMQYRTHCNCRKPAPGLIEELSRNWPIDMTRSVMVGNSDSDVAAASAAGITGVKCGQGSLVDVLRPYLISGTL